MRVRALLRLQAAEAEMAEVAERGRDRERDRDQDRDRDRLLRLLHAHAEAARRHVRRLSTPWHGYAAAPRGVQPSSGRDSGNELISRDASPALRSTSPDLAAALAPGAVAVAGARTPSPAPLPASVSRERGLWSLLLGGQ